MKECAEILIRWSLENIHPYYCLLYTSFSVALPDDTAVAVGGVPGFGTKNISAVAADNLSGERACLAVPFPAVFAPLQFVLNLCPCPRLYNGRVTVLHIVLRNLSLVDFGLLSEKVHGEGFLEQRGAFIQMCIRDSFYAALFVVMQLVVDFVYMLVDPRIRISEAK